MATKFMSINAAAEQLAVHPGTVRRWIAQGDLHAVKLAGSTWRIEQAELDRFLADAAGYSAAERRWLDRITAQAAAT